MENISIDTTKLSAKGQIVIPVDVRNKLQLETGNKLFVMASEDAIILQKTNSLNDKDKISFSQKAKSIARKMGLSL
uniref:SpoVT-AbrB domain-containing protein n=1 Tax=uncultured marine thaumarchaeote AD1000_11_E10 TaxID=1455890 RepID=A0A075FNX7_9ARCH|nr:hypothetical protein [uncultured marine thaumarchaeote AD1000_11_E10]|tara:strand:+ start:99 stop:326 length:228 start_codon:yes stop_codon:yes gene_type:complete